jgi:hypothetical protein
MGAAGVAAGLVIAVASLVLGLNGWEIARLWLWLMGSAMLILVGIQLVIYWLLMRVLEDLSQRELGAVPADVPQTVPQGEVGVAL